MATLSLFLKNVTSVISYRKKKTNNPIKFLKNYLKKQAKKRKHLWLQRRFRGVIAFWTPS